MGQTRTLLHTRQNQLPLSDKPVPPVPQEISEGPRRVPAHSPTPGFILTADGTAVVACVLSQKQSLLFTNEELTFSLGPPSPKAKPLHS